MHLSDLWILATVLEPRRGQYLEKYSVYEGICVRCTTKANDARAINCIRYWTTVNSRQNACVDDWQLQTPVCSNTSGWDSCIADTGALSVRVCTGLAAGCQCRSECVWQAPVELDKTRYPVQHSAHHVATCQCMLHPVQSYSSQPAGADSILSDRRTLVGCWSE